MSVTLREKFRGCIYGAHIGSAMGAGVEGWPYQKTEEKFGTLTTFESYQHYSNGWDREPGTTEDGIERQKLIITAIMEKGDRVTAEDIRAAWLNHANPNAAGWISEPFEGKLLAMAKSGIPAREIGRYCDYAGLVSFGRSCHPIGLINAGNIETAIADVMETAQLYQTTNSRGILWACVTAVAIAAATKPDATVQSVLDAVLEIADKKWVYPELKKHLDGTKDIKDFRALRAYFDEYYCNLGIPYEFSYANEVIVKGLCIFQMVQGNVKEAIIAAVNMGRDTDCAAAVACGISGALTGDATVPAEWIERVEYATSVNPHTCTKRTMKESADGLYDAFQKRLAKEKAFVEAMDIE